MNHLGGAFEQGDPLTYMPDIWGYLLVKYELKSVMDIGCGFGHALKWFAESGRCKILGVEGWHEAVERSQVPGSVIEHDFQLGIPPIRLSDLAWSAEFLEHVDEEYLPNVMPVFQQAKFSCITHGEPGQPGYHHVNCQSDDYWANKFSQYGMTLDEEETALLRRTDWGAMYGRRTLMFFVRN